MKSSCSRTWPERLTHRVAAAALVTGAVVLPVHASGLSREVDAFTETIVFARHGEKPTDGSGQLTCQELNRALALPAVIAAKFGTPAAVYAPDPGGRKDDHGQLYYYVRPLATIEPTAIQFGLPVQLPFDVTHIEELGRTVLNARYRGKLVVVAWEHHQIETLVKALVAAHGEHATQVPTWQGDDFDSLYVLKVDWHGGKPTVASPRP